MSTQSILVTGRSQAAILALESKLVLLKQEFPEVLLRGCLFAEVESESKANADEEVRLLIYNLATWTKKEAASVAEMREKFAGPILVLAHGADGSADDLQLDLCGINYLQKPFGQGEFSGVVRRLLMDTECRSEIPQRTQRRFVTKERAYIFFSGETRRELSRVFNLSKTGAYLEFDRGLEVKPGDTMTVELDLQFVRKSYTVPARVIWVAAGVNSQGPGVGIEFLKDQAG